MRMASSSMAASEMPMSPLNARMISASIVVICHPYRKYQARNLDSSTILTHCPWPPLLPVVQVLEFHELLDQLLL